MSIEFSCLKCGQQLRVSDESAGKRARCPKCNHINVIPQPDQAEGSSQADVPPEPPYVAAGDSPFAEQQPNPYSAPQTSYESSWGTAAPPTAGDGKIRNVRTDLGSILNYSFALWQQNLGLLVGAFVVIIAVGMVFSYGSQAMAMVLRRGGQQEVAIAVDVLTSIAGQLVQMYLSIGVVQLMLKLARHQRAEFSDVFGGGSRFLPVLGVSILFGLAVFGGLILLIIPGIILALMWWPCYYLVVDGKASVGESFGLARTITQGNMGTTFLVWLLGLGISALGFLVCCVGIIPAAPLVAMLYVVAYLMMSGQIPLQPQSTSRVV